MEVWKEFGEEGVREGIVGCNVQCCDVGFVQGGDERGNCLRVRGE